MINLVGWVAQVGCFQSVLQISHCGFTREGLETNPPNPPKPTKGVPCDYSRGFVLDASAQGQCPEQPRHHAWSIPIRRESSLRRTYLPPNLAAQQAIRRTLAHSAAHVPHSIPQIPC